MIFLKSYRKYIFGAAVIIVGLIFAPFMRASALNGVFLLLRPILLYESSAREKINSWTAYFAGMAGLEKDIQELTKENLLLKERIIDYEILREENNAFKKTISSFQTKTNVLLKTKIIGRYYDSSGYTIFIDGGVKNGIVKGALIIAGERSLLGRVAYAAENISGVVALRNTGSTFNVTILPRAINANGQNLKITEGLFIGRGDSITIDLVPNSAEVKVGDILVMHDFDYLGISGLVVGEVVAASKSQSGIFQNILAREIMPSLGDTVFAIRQGD